MWYCLQGERCPAGITKQLLEEVPAASSLTLRISTRGRHMRCQARNLTWWKWQQRHNPHYVDRTWMFNCHLLFSLSLSRQEEDTAVETVTDPAYLSGKHSFLATLHLGSRKAESISGPRLSCQEENREHHLLKHLRGIWRLLHCAPKPQSKAAVPRVTQRTSLWPQLQPMSTG